MQQVNDILGYILTLILLLPLLPLIPLVSLVRHFATAQNEFLTDDWDFFMVLSASQYHNIRPLTNNKIFL